MIYEPKVLYNPTDKKIEFMCNRITYIFKPYEKKVLEGFPAFHALHHVNTGLVEYSIEGAPQAVKEEFVLPQDEEVAYDKLPWRKLVSLGSARGIFAPGMGKEDLIEKLKESDGSKA